MNEFLENKKDAMEILGFWDDTTKSVMIHCLESRYKREILREWCITDIIPNGNQYLFKWQKRFKPLTDEEITDKYGNNE